LTHEARQQREDELLSDLLDVERAEAVADMGRAATRSSVRAPQRHRTVGMLQVRLVAVARTNRSSPGTPPGAFVGDAPMKRCALVQHHRFVRRAGSRAAPVLRNHDPDQDGRSTAAKEFAQ